MTILISPTEVLSLAFGSSHGLDTDAVSESVILSAQQKHIRPVIGGLYQRVASGELDLFLENYLKPALAHYVKLLLLPTLAISAGNLGLVAHKSANFIPADKSNLIALRNSTRQSALSLMRRAVEHIEANRELYPEYDPAQNVLNRISISSNIVG